MKHHQHHQTCAACKFQRRKCGQDCPTAPYFPANMYKQFVNAHRLFGVAKITKLLNSLPPHLRSTAMSSLTAEANHRANDPVGGSYRLIMSLMSLINHNEDELHRVRSQLCMFRGGGNVLAPSFDDYKYGVALGHGYDGSQLHQFQNDVVHDCNVFDSRDGVVIEQDFNLISNEEDEERGVKAVPLRTTYRLLKNKIVQEHGNVVDEELVSQDEEESNVFDLRDELMLEQDDNPIQDGGGEENRDVKLMPLLISYEFQNNIGQEHSDSGEELVPQSHQVQSNVIVSRNEVVLEQDVNPIQDEDGEEGRDVKVVPIHSTYQLQNNIDHEHRNVGVELVPRPHEEHNNVLGVRDEVVNEDVNPIQDAGEEEERDIKPVPLHSIYQLQMIKEE